MARRFRWLLVASSLSFMLSGLSAQTAKPAKPQPKTDAEIQQAIIDESIAAYSGSCPCPYNRDRAGRRCGKRSAYNRPGGASPVCFDSDVTPKMIEAYRKTKRK